MMTFIRLTAGRQISFCCAKVIARGVLGTLLLLLASGISVAADQFPFDQELLLEAAPMRPAKRMPILTVAPDGNATIDLWCKTVPARVEITDATIKIEPGPLPEGLPEMMSGGQCTPARMQADDDMLAALAQVTAWRKEGPALVLVGPKTLKFRPSDH
jgi:heat shock protein HslJ